MYGYIYKTTCLVNNKIYICQHKHEVFDKKYYGSGILVSRAIEKYGIEKFNVELIEECLSQDELNEKEIYYISFFNSNDKTVGYNIADGGKCITITDEEYFDSIRPKLQHVGQLNGNCKCSLEECNKIKILLDKGLSIQNIHEITGTSKRIISSIRKGKHWSCKDDNYVCTTKVIKKKKEKVVLSEEEISEHKEHKKLLQKLKRDEREIEFLKTNHYCLMCGSLITKLIGTGSFCSKRCGCRYGAINRDNTNIIEGIKKRDYRGEKNPNFGKVSSEETREKLSIAFKNSVGVKNSPRFLGHKHSEESKQKISNSLKRNKERKNG